MAARGRARAVPKDPEVEKLEELQSLIVNPDDVGEPLANPEVPNRRLLYKGALDRILPTGVVEDGIVILLSDLLIYCLEDAHGRSAAAVGAQRGNGMEPHLKSYCFNPFLVIKS